MGTYRTRLRSSRPADHERELPPPPDSKDEYDLDACLELFFAVLETAIHDYRYLKKLEDAGTLRESDKKKVRAITEDNHPADFFGTRWFRDICHLLGLDPDAVVEISAIDEDDRRAVA